MSPRTRWIACVGVLILGGIVFLRTKERIDRDTPAPPPDVAVLPGLDSLRALVQNGDFTAAERLARLQLARAEAVSDSTQIAAVLDVLVTALWRGGKSGQPESMQFGKRALDLKVALYGAEHPEVATSQRNLGILCEQSGQYAQAKAHYERALSIREHSVTQREAVVESWTDLGILLYLTAEYERAQGCIEQALKIASESLEPEHPDLGWTWNILGAIRMRLGDYVGARRAFERTLAIREHAHGPDHPEVAGVLNNLGGLYLDMGDTEAARPALERALRIREARLGPDHPETATTLSNLAECSRLNGDFAAAGQFMQRSLSIQRASLGLEHEGTAQAMWKYAAVLQEAGNDSAATRMFQQASNCFEAALGPAHPLLALCLLDWSTLESEMQRPDAARQHAQRALAILQRSLGPEDMSIGSAQAVLARAHAAGGSAAAAFDAAVRAEEVGRDHLRWTMRALAERPALRFATVRPSGLDIAVSVVAADAAPGTVRRAWDEVVRSRALVYDEMASRHASVWMAPDPALSDLAEELHTARSHLAHLMARGIGSESPQIYRALLDAARQKKEQSERALAEASTAFRQELASARIGLADVQHELPADAVLVAYVAYQRFEVSVKRPSTSAAMATSRWKPIPSYLAFVLRSRSAPVAIPLGEGARIDSLISRWRREVSRGETASGSRANEELYRQAGEKLRRVVWDPMASHTQDARLILVVADGALQLVNLATLPTASGYLIETSPPIHLLSTERDLVNAAASSWTGNGLLALGGPDFDVLPHASQAPRTATVHSEVVTRAVSPTLPCADLSSIRFAPLPATLQELEEIGQIWRAAPHAVPPKRAPSGRPGSRGGQASETADARLVRALTAGQATEQAFAQLAPGKRVVHLATHGFFLTGACLEAAADTRGIKPERSQPPARAEPGENPFRLSGFAMTGANRHAAGAADDGILTAEEITTLDLRGVEWAVLSACDTGVGEVLPREGVLGLRRAFQLAGTRTVIMSLWSVQDEATRQWMRRLYEERLLRASSTAGAVQAASQALLRDRRNRNQSTHPFYWGGFVAVGDWR